MRDSYAVNARVCVLRTRRVDEENETSTTLASSGGDDVDLHVSFYDRNPDAPAFSASRAGSEVPMVALWVAVGDVVVHIETDLLEFDLLARLGAAWDRRLPREVGIA